MFEQLFGQNEKERAAKIRHLAGNEAFWISISGRGWGMFQCWKPFEIFRGWTKLREVMLVFVEHELHGGVTQLRKFGDEPLQDHQKLFVEERAQGGEDHEWVLGLMKKGFEGLNEGHKEVRLGREVALD